MFGKSTRSGDSLQNQRYFIYLFICLFVFCVFQCLPPLPEKLKKAMPVLQAKGDF